MENNDLKDACTRYNNVRDSQTATYDNYARINGMSSREFNVIKRVYYAPKGCLQTQLCVQLGASKQTISAIIKKLDERGIVKLETYKNDRRGKLVTLTKKGRDMATQLITPVEQAELESMSTLCDEEIETLYRLTKRYCDVLRGNISNLPLLMSPIDFDLD